jgi:hypothetical protein
MELVRNLKGAQWFRRCLVALNHFISCLNEHGMSLYKLLKKSKQFEWTEEAQYALNQLKHFSTTRLVVVPQPKGRQCSYMT